jgi:tRNA A37 threonylcarbamoyladenosine dehydratase
MSVDHERRFGGVARLYGEEGAERLRLAHVCIIGMGGVGSWSAEAIARTGIGRITTVDLDIVAESNTNRQIQALGDNFGKAKVDAITERILAINPNCQVSSIDDFVTPENVEQILGQGFSVIIDAIDQVRPKAAMINFCRGSGGWANRPDSDSRC